MKKTFLFCLFFTVFFTHAQEKYSDIQIGTKYTLIQLKEAVNKASWCGYYHSEFEFELTFDDGAIVNLKRRLTCRFRKSGRLECAWFAHPSVSQMRNAPRTTMSKSKQATSQAQGDIEQTQGACTMFKRRGRRPERHRRTC